MASTARVGTAVPATTLGTARAATAAHARQAAWLALFLGALAVAISATPALYAHYQTVCPLPICDSLPQPNDQTVALLARIGIPLPRYAAVMVGVEWLSMLLWCALGALIVWKRPGDLVAILLASSGVVGGSKAFLDALSVAHPDADLPSRVGGLVTAIAVPLLIALFPDGRWVPRWTRWVVLVTIGYGVVWSIAEAPLPGILAALELPLGVAPLLVLLGAQIYRYRRVSTTMQRQQAKWVLFGFSLFVANVTVGSLAFSFAEAARFQIVFLILCYGVFLLLGTSVTFAILRYRLFDIELIINRTLVYGGLTAIIVGLYALIVVGLGALFRAQGDPGIALLATGVVAVAFTPVRDRLQRGANHLLYGDRDEPYAVLSRLARQLEEVVSPAEMLPAIVGTLAEALRLPYAAIVLEGEPRPTAVAGTPVADAVRIPLIYQHTAVGELIVAPRDPGEPLSPADRRLLGDLARQIGVAAHAVRLTADLQRSRERIVAAREEERRRLRRDLHDGLGAQLAALAIQAGALRTMIARDPAAATEQAAELRGELRAAVADIRRLVHGLRPPALDELGLVDALRQRAARYGVHGAGNPEDQEGPGLVATVDAPASLPILSAAVEVAVYRIVDESLANVVKHAEAHSCVIRLETRSPSWLTVQIDDDGSGIPEMRVNGVGLLSMRERAEELGGRLEIGPRPDGPGTRLRVELPLAPAEREP